MKPCRKCAVPMVRWTSSRKRLRALSVRQPWAWLIVNGYKEVENRGWATKYHGPLLMHAGAGRKDLRDDMDSVELEFGIRLPVEDEYDFGGIVRVVELLGCRENAGPPWHNGGAIGWVLGKPRRLPFRQIKGALGLFRPAS